MGNADLIALAILIILATAPVFYPFIKTKRLALQIFIILINISYLIFAWFVPAKISNNYMILLILSLILSTAPLLALSYLLGLPIALFNKSIKQTKLNKIINVIIFIILIINIILILRPTYSELEMEYILFTPLIYLLSFPIISPFTKINRYFSQVLIIVVSIYLLRAHIEELYYICDTSHDIGIGHMMGSLIFDDFVLFITATYIFNIIISFFNKSIKKTTLNVSIDIFILLAFMFVFLYVPTISKKLDHEGGCEQLSLIGKVLFIK